MNADDVVGLSDIQAAAGRIEKPGLSRVQGDITDAASCRAVMPEGLDAVFHVAADTSHWKRQQVRLQRIASRRHPARD